MCNDLLNVILHKGNGSSSDGLSPPVSSVGIGNVRNHVDIDVGVVRPWETHGGGGGGLILQQCDGVGLFCENRFSTKQKNKLCAFSFRCCWLCFLSGIERGSGR